MRRKSADEDPGGANADDWPPGCEKLAKVIRRSLETDISAVNPACKPVHLTNAERRHQALRRDGPAGGQCQNRRPGHRRTPSLPPTIIIEKYGAEASPRSSSGDCLSSGSVARSM